METGPAAATRQVGIGKVSVEKEEGFTIYLFVLFAACGTLVE